LREQSTKEEGCTMARRMDLVAPLALRLHC